MQSVLEYLFLALVAFIIICFFFRRFRRVRRQPQRQVTFLPSAWRRYPNFRRPVEFQPQHPDRQSYPACPDPVLREIPAAHINPSNRRTRARDIDTSGRRQDIPTETDHDGDLGANDALPAYDNLGGPPKYVELDMLSRNRPPQSGITQTQDANMTSPVGVQTPVGTTHAAQVNHDISRPRPP